MERRLSSYKDRCIVKGDTHDSSCFIRGRIGRRMRDRENMYGDTSRKQGEKKSSTEDLPMHGNDVSLGVPGKVPHKGESFGLSSDLWR